LLQRQTSFRSVLPSSDEAKNVFWASYVAYITPAKCGSSSLDVRCPDRPFTYVRRTYGEDQQ
jgi:hypothetical protein